MSTPFLDLIGKATVAAQEYRSHDLTKFAETLADTMDDETAETAARITALLRAARKSRFHDQIRLVGEAALKTGYETPLVWTNFAQSLIERGSQMSAIGLMEARLRRHGNLSAHDTAELCGVLGRGWKDIAYEALLRGRTAAAASALAKSFAYYKQGYDLNPADVEMCAWHGNQMAALAAWAERSGLPSPLPNWKTHAANCLAGLAGNYAQQTAHNPWHLTGAGELCVALGRLDEAAVWYKRAIAEAKADAFTLSSTHRQITQILGVEATEAGKDIAATLIEALADKGATFQILSSSARELQARIGSGGPAPLTTVKRALDHAQSVGMVRNGDIPLATGFLVRAQDIGLDAKHGIVFLTNAHVVSKPRQENAISPEDAAISFELLDKDKYQADVSILASLPVNRHDCTVLGFGQALPTDLKPLTVGNMPDKLPDDPRAVLIGHPQGQEISFSFLDSALLGFEPAKGAAPQRLQYRSPTDLGSSGSPVFDRNWRVIGIHRAYEPNSVHYDGRPGTFAANEGVSLQSIRAAFQAGEGIA